ncbi:MAG: signal peptide peptidase SppA, partial [Polyangiaceae bacterium]
CGHSFEIATPLVFGLGTGLRLDYVQTPWTAGFPYNGYDYVWLTWALGWKLSDMFALGVSLERSYSVDTYLDGLFGISAGITFRPNTHFAFAAIAHDFNGPSTQALPPFNLPVLDQSYDFAGAFRPTGRRGLEIGLDMQYLQGSDQFIPRGTAAIDIPGVGRARGDLAAAHVPNDARRGVVGTVGLEVYLDSFSAGGGLMFGNGLGDSSSVGEYGTAAISGYLSSGVPLPKKAVSIRIEDTPDARAHIELLHKLWYLADDPRYSAVALLMRTEPASSFAHAEELADAIRVLKSRGKKVLCSLEDNGAKALYVCANADRIVVNPAGGIRYAGLRTQYLYFAGLLSKLGIKADIVRISDHKSAPEEFTNEHASDVARSDHEDTLREYEAVFTKNLAQGRHMSEEHVRAITKNGPFVASEARSAGLVDGYAFDDELDGVMSEMLGHDVKLHKFEDEPTWQPDTFGIRWKIGLLLVEGDMIDGRSQHIPLIDERLVGSYSMAEKIKEMREDPLIRAVVLRIESPGGSSMAADVMWRELELLAKKKPLIVSMGTVAASGGYYIASPAKTIFAEPLTITGSIGIFYGKADVSGLLQKIGINVETYKTAPRADAESFFRPFTDEERVALGVKIHQFYDVFLDRVSRGRHMTKAEVDAVGEGRVWTGQEALDHKLVDKMGGLREALAEARRVSGLPYDAPIDLEPPPEKSLIEKAIQVVVGKDAASATIESLPIQVRELARELAPMTLLTGDVPMARLEWVSADER